MGVDALVQTVTAVYGEVDPDSTLPPVLEMRTASTLSTLPLATLNGDATRGAIDLEVIGLLGEGGMGRVELARQGSLGRDVAIKTVRDGVAGPQATEALLVEARHAGRLEHPNIVPVHALARTADDRAVMVMKRVEGVAWRDLILDPAHPFWARRGGEDRLDLHLDVFQQVCNAAHFAHSRGLVHRDIKPANVMLGAYGEVYLVDWGLAVEAGLPQGAAAGVLVGTPAYMAPEMLDGTAPTGPATDVYLLGATLYEAVTGQRLHGGAGIRAVLESAAESATPTYDESVPAELAAICTRATARRISDRYGSAQEVRDAIADFRRHRGSVDLAQEAARGFAALKAAPTADEAVRRGVADSIVGYQQALRIWRDNAAAREGLRELIAWMADFELTRRNRGAAASLIADLASPPPDLVARLEALDRELREAELAASRLQELERHRDASVAWRSRMLGISVVLLACTALAGFQATEKGSQMMAATLESTMVVNAVVASIASVVLVYLRGSPLGTRFNTSFVGMVLVITGGGFLQAALYRVIGVPLETFLVGHGVLSLAVAVTVGITLQRDIAWLGIGPLFTAVAVTLDPGHAMHYQTVGFMLGAAVFLLLYGRGPVAAD